MPKMKNVLAFFRDPHARLTILSSRGFLKWMSDEQFLKRMYRIRLGKSPDLEAPRTFNEKMQWLKLHDRRPLYTQMVDKYAVRGYIGEQIGTEYLIPLVGGPWESFDEIDFDALPEQFVLKCTHDSGGLVICRDKAGLDVEAARRKIERSLRRNYYVSSREWPYKDVKPRIIAEKYMEAAQSSCLPVYKILNFDGEPRLIQTIQNDKTPQESIDYFTPEWELLEMRQNYPNSAVPLERPECLETMLTLAKRLNLGLPFIRTDFYEIDGRVYFSEFTFYSDAGFAPFTPREWDERLGGWITLPASADGGKG